MGYTVNPQDLFDHAFQVGRFEPRVAMAQSAADEISGLDWHMSYGLMCQFFPVGLIPVNNAGQDILGKLTDGYGRVAQTLTSTARDYGQRDQNIAQHMRQLEQDVRAAMGPNPLVDPKSQIRPEDYGVPGPGGGLEALNPITSGHEGNWTSGLKTVNDARIIHQQVTDEGTRNLAVLQATTASFGIGTFRLATDPIGTLAAMGAGWAMDHIKPLKMLLDGLAGNPTMVKGAAASWHKIGTHLDGIGDQFSAEVTRGTRRWRGKAADAYRGGAAHNLLDATETTALLARSMGTVVAVTGEMVTHVRTFVRDLIASLVADLVKAGLKRLVGLTGGPVEELGKVAAAAKAAHTVVGKLVSCFGTTLSTVSQLLDVLKTAAKIVPLLNGP